MKVSFSVRPDERVAEMTNALKGKHAAIFTRIERYNECVAIVPDHDYKSDLVYWVWLNGEEGSFTDGEKRTKDAVIRSLIDGEWTYQPNATMTGLYS